MKFEFDKSFEKALSKLGNPALMPRVAKAVKDVQAATSINDIPTIKKLKGFTHYYRLKPHSDYRIGLELKGDTIWFITIANRKDIYRVFP
jgi:mRNA interferase RelE/StbE